MRCDLKGGAAALHAILLARQRKNSYLDEYKPERASGTLLAICRRYLHYPLELLIVQSKKGRCTARYEQEQTPSGYSRNPFDAPTHPMRTTISPAPKSKQQRSPPQKSRAA